ncbi:MULTISPECIES: hypothetical protein [Clostridium]|nr:MULTISPECIES: hypothetical protein [Clostridium]APU60744.1 hypothetical protein NPD8_2703 [Clostridium botulinum]MBY7069188.1 hypothetical protein [Clostridium sporogenes]NFC89755.1 hypothetical protein [Clostridium botulinum]NFQ01686.1 hypothetical protein [Clostridium sporogenes]NFQ42720.1 hypothetical protein [Clostridium sporogenes]
MKKIKTNIKNNVISLIITLIFFSVSLLIYKNNPLQISELKILDDEFVINFILIVLGFTVSFITILYSTFEKLRQQLVEIFKNIISETELKDMELIMFNIFKQLKEDILFIFRYLVDVVFIIIWRNIDIPYIKWNFNYISKLDIILLIKLTIIFLTLLALYDIIKSIFKLIEVSLNADVKKSH